MTFTSNRLGRCFCTVAILLGMGLGRSIAQPDLYLPEEALPGLGDLIDSAMLQSPRMIVRHAEEIAADGDLWVAKAARLPNFGGWAQWVRSREDRGDFSDPLSAEKSYYSFSITQPLFHWGAISRSVDTAKIRKAIDDGRTEQAYLALVQDLRANYLLMVRDRRTLERMRFATQIMDERLEEARGRRAQNQISDADLFNVELSHERNAVSLALALESFETTRRVVGRMSGRATPTEDTVPLEYPKPQVEEEAGVLASLLARFIAAEIPDNIDIEIALKELEVRHNDLHVTRMTLRPKINLVTGITQDEQSYTANIAQKYEVQSVFGGVSMSWTLFDGFANRARVKSAVERLRAAEVNLDAQKAEMIDRAASFGRQLKILAMSVEIAEKELGSARSHLDLTGQRAGRGEASKAELNSATLNLHDVMGSTLYARSNYWTKVSEFLGLIGADPVLDRLPASHR